MEPKKIYGGTIMEVMEVLHQAQRLMTPPRQHAWSTSCSA
jgi:hypothetical protein